MKLLKKLCIVLLILCLLGGSFLTYLGYQQYKEVTALITVPDKVAQIQEDSTFVDYDRISPYLLQATIAIEDRRFYKHEGFDIIATTRAFFANVFSQEIVGGGSTISQQLAKNMYFDHNPSIVRKISELFIVHDLESTYSKDEILTLYVNIINYGDQHMGIQEASNGYFQKSADALTIDEASLLAGLPQSPSNYQLSNHYPQAQVRQRQVLAAMVGEEFIDQAMMDAILSRQ